MKLKKKDEEVTTTNGGTYSMILHDKTAGADFLDEVRVKSVSSCQSVVTTSGIHETTSKPIIFNRLATPSHKKFIPSHSFKLTALYWSAFGHVVPCLLGTHCR